jgi:hypothetical protein
MCFGLFNLLPDLMPNPLNVLSRRHVSGVAGAALIFSRLLLQRGFLLRDSALHVLASALYVLDSGLIFRGASGRSSHRFLEMILVTRP